MTNEDALKGFADYCKECRTNAQTLGADVVCGVCKVFVAKQAIEMQIPKKPVLKHDVSHVHYNMGDKPHQWRTLESDNWHCPICNGFVGERVYVGTAKKFHDQRKKDFCDRCGKAIDWDVETKE